jgi:HSP20 family protein
MLRMKATDPFSFWRGAFSEFDRMRRDLDFLLGGGSVPSASDRPFPLFNLSEDEENYYARAHLPGVLSEDIDLSIVGNTLTVKGARKLPLDVEGVNMHRQERYMSEFSRTISLPREVDAGQVRAKCKDGVLTITLPKAEDAKPLQIDVDEA